MNQQAPTERRPATYQDVLDAPRDMVAELIEGALHLQPRPASPHARASIGSWAYGSAARSTAVRRGPGAGGSSTSPSCTSARTCSFPISRAGVASGCRAYPDVPWFDLAPDWVCEVLSPSTRRIDLTDQAPHLRAPPASATSGSSIPSARTLEAFALRDGAWTLVAALKDDEEVRVPPFDAIAFPLSVLWPD